MLLYIKSINDNNKDLANDYLRQIRTFDKKYLSRPDYVNYFKYLIKLNLKENPFKDVGEIYRDMADIEPIIDIEKGIYPDLLFR